MTEVYTLPDLQAELDRLRFGDRLALATADFQRLFGETAIAQEQLENFAKGHACVLIRTPAGIVFFKKERRD